MSEVTSRLAPVNPYLAMPGLFERFFKSIPSCRSAWRGMPCPGSHRPWWLLILFVVLLGSYKFIAGYSHSRLGLTVVLVLAVIANIQVVRLGHFIMYRSWMRHAFDWEWRHFTHDWHAMHVAIQDRFNFLTESVTGLGRAPAVHPVSEEDTALLLAGLAAMEMAVDRVMFAARTEVFRDGERMYVWRYRPCNIKAKGDETMRRLKELERSLVFLQEAEELFKQKSPAAAFAVLRTGYIRYWADPVTFHFKMD
ncbi:MAG: hypothetical protein Q7R83_01375 [bacterium]|nr:hypothetical protein [bacterium]